MITMAKNKMAILNGGNSMEFVLCYEKLNEKGFYENTWEIIIGEDAMNVRLAELEEELGIDSDDVMVFDKETEW